MENKPVINIIATRCQPEFEEKFNTWYNEVHVPMLLKFKGLKEVMRCKIVDGTGETPEYLAIYTFESQKAFEAYETSPELAAAREELGETWKEGGWERKWRVQYEVIKTWGK